MMLSLRKLAMLPAVIQVMIELWNVEASSFAYRMESPVLGGTSSPLRTSMGSPTPNGTVSPARLQIERCELGSPSPPRKASVGSPFRKRSLGSPSGKTPLRSPPQKSALGTPSRKRSLGTILASPPAKSTSPPGKLASPPGKSALFSPFRQRSSGSPSSGTASQFNKRASDYARFRPSYPDSLYEELAGLCPGRDLAWDVGCGNGQATLGLARHFNHVIGSDISAGQLAEAPQAGNVEYCLLNAEWPLEQLQTAQPRLSSESVDLVTVAQALHYFDLDRFYENVKAVLKPNGLLAVWTYKLPVLPNNETANLLLQHIYYNVVGQYWAPERRLVNACYRTLPFPFEDVMRCVEEPWGAMRMTWDVGALMGYLRSWSATEKAIEVLGSNPVENYRHQFQAVWDPAGEAVEVPLYLCVGRPHNHS